MAKKIDDKSVINPSEEILKQIKDLIPQAPNYWMDAIAGKLKCSRTSVYYYSKGRGMRKGLPNDVLRELTILVKKEIEDKELLIQASSQLSKAPKTCNPKKLK
ncbi:MAG TPA: hypothetical protein VGK38_07670 [Prolixibacteraceae bacterium]